MSNLITRNTLQTIRKEKQLQLPRFQNANIQKFHFHDSEDSGSGKIIKSPQVQQAFTTIQSKIIGQEIINGVV